MKLTNSTTWPDYFLRRVVAWCCHELELPVRRVQRAAFRNSKTAWGGAGYYWQQRVTVCVGGDKHFPSQSITHRNGHQQRVADRIECLVWVTAHELSHLLQAHTRSRQSGSGGGSEIATEWHATPVLERFRAQRDVLLPVWQAAPALRAPQPALSLQERRLRKAQQDLARWQRKLKLARGKVIKYQLKVRRYEKRYVPPVQTQEA